MGVVRDAGSSLPWSVVSRLNREEWGPASAIIDEEQFPGRSAGHLLVLGCCLIL